MALGVTYVLCIFILVGFHDCVHLSKLIIVSTFDLKHETKGNNRNLIYLRNFVSATIFVWLRNGLILW